jgi:hypothetical protein
MKFKYNQNSGLFLYEVAAYRPDYVKIAKDAAQSLQGTNASTTKKITKQNLEELITNIQKAIQLLNSNNTDFDPKKAPEVIESIFNILPQPLIDHIYKKLSLVKNQIYESVAGLTIAGGVLAAGMAGYVLKTKLTNYFYKYKNAKDIKDKYELVLITIYILKVCNVYLDSILDNKVDNIQKLQSLNFNDILTSTDLELNDVKDLKKEFLDSKDSMKEQKYSEAIDIYITWIKHIIELLQKFINKLKELFKDPPAATPEPSTPTPDIASKQIEAIKKLLDQGIDNVLNKTDESSANLFLKYFFNKIIIQSEDIAALIYDLILTNDDEETKDFLSRYMTRYDYTEERNELPPITRDYLINQSLKIFKNIKKTLNQKTSIKEQKLLKEYREEINNLLIPTMQKQLKFDKIPTLNFIEDEENAKDMFGRTAYYNPNTSEITVFITGRHPKDIMRSVAHEVIHHSQNCRGEFDDVFNVGEEGYAQSNNHLRNMEEEAYLLGNMLFRDWEDNLKKQRNSNTMINEKVLRAKIRALISEMTDQGAFEIENKAMHKYDESCDCEQCSQSTRDALKMKGIRPQGYMAESTKKVLDAEKEVMPLNEWRRMELNSLLLNRFGIVSPEVLGEKKKMPMKKDVEDADGDGDTNEKVPAFLKKGSAKKPAKKGKVPPQLQKYVKGKKDESK